MADKRKLDESTEDNSESMSLHDIIAESEELENTANAVLGGSDQHSCTYDRGYIYRQALYACSTCRGESGAEVAGICLACSLECHDGHDLFELYTKRYFRCDCGNKKFKSSKCRFNQSKDDYNVKNIYNHNFEGKYCTCSRPYPDQEDSIDDEMIQCVVCEDWYHSRHLVKNCDIPEDYEEMICHKCSSEFNFLRYYNGTTVRVHETETNINVNVVDTNNINAVNGNGKDTVKVEESPLSIKEKNQTLNAANNKSSETPASESEKNESVINDKKNTCGIQDKIPDVKMVKIIPVKITKDIKDIKEQLSNSKCKLEALKKICSSELLSDALFFKSGWRKDLCKCDDCDVMMENKNLKFLYKMEDTISEYEKSGSGLEIKTYNKGMEALSEMDRVQQVEVIHGYNDMKSELVDYLKSLGQGKVVTENDIKSFFEQLKTKKKPRVDMGYFCK